MYHKMGTTGKEKGIFMLGEMGPLLSSLETCDHIFIHLIPQGDKAEDLNYRRTQTHIMCNKMRLSCIM